MRWIMVLAMLVACGRAGDQAGGPGAARPRTPGVRVTMNALHAMGGVPQGWKLTPPPGDVDAGRTAFIDFGCPSCHRVEGEAFSAKATTTQVGPELTGMGAHHPSAYFAEAILNPDAVLVEGEGYIGPDGHSVMPDYPEMTTQQLGDLVAYLASLKTGGPHAGHVMGGGAGAPAGVVARPLPPEQPAKAFFIQSYDVTPGALEPFEKWMKEGGAQRFRDLGVVSIDTYVDFTRERNRYISIFGYPDCAALQKFMDAPAGLKLGIEFDAFIGEHGHTSQMWTPIYRVASLSSP